MSYLHTCYALDAYRTRFVPGLFTLRSLLFSVRSGFATLRTSIVLAFWAWLQCT